MPTIFLLCKWFLFICLWVERCRAGLDMNFGTLGGDLRALLRKASHEPFDFTQGGLYACSCGSIRLRATRFAQDDGYFLLVLWFRFVSGLKRCSHSQISEVITFGFAQGRLWGTRH